MMKRIVVLLAALVGSAVAHAAEAADPSVVTTEKDVINAKDGLVSLSEALEYALQNPVDGVARVTFADALFGSSNTVVCGFSDGSTTLKASSPKVLIEAPGGKSVVIRFTPPPADPDENQSVTYQRSPRCRGFVVCEGAELELKGVGFAFTVGATAGATGLLRDTSGGAILCYGTLTVKDGVFADCLAGPHSGAVGSVRPTGFGGAIAVCGPGVATIEGTTFENCHAANGGAVAALDGGKMTLRNPVFRNNKAWTTLTNQGWGGAAFCPDDGQSELTIEGAPVFEGNKSVDAGGIEIESDEGRPVYDDYGNLVFAVPESYPSELTVASAQKLRTESPAVAQSLAPKLSVAGGYAEAVAEGQLIVFVPNAAATPGMDGVDFGAEGEDVRVVPENVKPGLWYGLGHAETPAGPYAVDRWLQADANGALPGPLTAPKASGSGFYRVIVSGNP